MNIIADWNLVLFYALLIKLVKLTWLDICQVVFLCFMDQEEVIVQKTTNSRTEKNNGQYPAILTKQSCRLGK